MRVVLAATAPTAPAVAFVAPPEPHALNQSAAAAAAPARAQPGLMMIRGSGPHAVLPRVPQNRIAPLVTEPSQTPTPLLASLAQPEGPGLCGWPVETERWKRRLHAAVAAACFWRPCPWILDPVPATQPWIRDPASPLPPAAHRFALYTSPPALDLDLDLLPVCCRYGLHHSSQLQPLPHRRPWPTGGAACPLPLLPRLLQPPPLLQPLPRLLSLAVPKSAVATPRYSPPATPRYSPSSPLAKPVHPLTCNTTSYCLLGTACSLATALGNVMPYCAPATALHPVRHAAPTPAPAKGGAAAPVGGTVLAALEGGSRSRSMALHSDPGSTCMGRYALDPGSGFTHTVGLKAATSCCSHGGHSAPSLPAARSLPAPAAATALRQPTIPRPTYPQGSSRAAVPAAAVRPLSAKAAVTVATAAPGPRPPAIPRPHHPPGSRAAAAGTTAAAPGPRPPAIPRPHCPPGNGAVAAVAASHLQLLQPNTSPPTCP